MSRPLPQSEAPQLPAVATPFPPPDKLDRILQNLVRRALQETRASSAAIGVIHESAMVCRAAAGLPLSHVGEPIDIESGLTAMAVRREMSQWCSDTESDGRVDPEVCQRLGVRSIIVVPVRSAQSVVGVFAVFATTPDAFSLEQSEYDKKAGPLDRRSDRKHDQKPPHLKPHSRCREPRIAGDATPFQSLFRADIRNENQKFRGEDLACAGSGIAQAAQ